MIYDLIRAKLHFAYILVQCFTFLFFVLIHASYEVFWFTELLLAFLPLVFFMQLASIGFGIFFFRPFWKWTSIILSIILLYSLSYFAQLEPKKAKIDMKNAFKIMSYNVHNFDAHEWWRNYESRSKFYRLFKDEQADIICFQEFYSLKSPAGFNYIDSLKEVFGYQHYYFHVMEQDEGQQYHGISIFSKHPILNTGRLDYYPATKNGTVFADIQIKEQIIRVYSSHFESVRLSMEDKAALRDLGQFRWENIGSILDKFKLARSRRKEQVQSVVNDIQACPYPVIACGDYNGLPLSSSYLSIKYSRDLKDAFMEKGHGWGGTLKSFIPWLRIDHLFVDEQLKIIDYSTPKYDYSDHYPIISHLSF